ncbi:MAG: hypothetical protein ABIZ04_17365 [Opitutus sp.]
MKHSPDDLEKFIHQTLRSLPNRPAPRSLEARVLAAIDQRAALPWWKHSFARWPVAAKGAFLVLSAGLVKLALMFTVWAVGGFQGSEVVAAFVGQFTWVDAIVGAVRAMGDSVGIVVRNIPAFWLYGIIAAVAAVYATLFSVGATAYRALYSHR